MSTSGEQESEGRHRALLQSQHEGDRKYWEKLENNIRGKWHVWNLKVQIQEFMRDSETLVTTVCEFAEAPGLKSTTHGKWT